MCRGLALLLLLGGCDLVLLGSKNPELPDARSGPVFRTITISPTGAAPIPKFPVSITTTDDAALKSRARPDGSDIYFTTPEGAPLPFERVAYEDGSLEAWVLVDLDGPKQLRMHYGGEPMAASGTDVWSGQAMAAYHLASDTQDSTPAGHHLSAASTAPAITPGVVGTGRTFVDDDTGQCQRLCVPAGDVFAMRDSSFSYSFWIKPGVRVSQYDQPVYAGGAADTVPGFDFELSMSGWAANISDGVMHDQQQIATPPSGWVHVTVVYRSGVGLLSTFINGQQTAMQMTPALGMITSRPMCLGGPECYTGDIDEVRIYPDSKEPRWIDAEYDNIANRNTFVTIGDEQAAGQ